ncbi:MAG: type I secretion system permease/ATPase, partial [Roseibium sp.]
MSFRNIAELGILSLFLNALMLVVPLYMIQVYDRIIPSNSMETLIYLSMIAGVALALAGFLDYARLRYSSRLAAQLDTRLGEPVFMASLRTGEGASGDVQPLRDLASLKAFIGSRAIAILFDLPFAPLFLAAL